ncbi:DUF4279 domain-containing protein [Magnetospira sp. QH-2]|uniref:DUF4279 domain-containing protein n=1 Tax=Magnetospira sp. (strain QH-2) TaxID=1288970 RepID=UPI0005FA2088|nr:DUF4279 domain-containing protein [Magnetospira sp. QH-2]
MVNAGVVLEPSETTSVELLEKIPFWYIVEKWHCVMGNGRFDTSDLFYGLDARDHLSVLEEALEDVLPILGQIVNHDAKVTITLQWIGRVGASPPRISSSDLGRLCLPGVTFEMTADWDHGNHHGPIQDVSFCVYGPHPDEVSSFWGLPTRALVKGTTSVSKATGKTRVQRVNAWLLNINSEDENASTENQLKRLFERLGTPAPEWHSFVEKTGARVQVGLHWEGASGAIEPILNYETLKAIGSYKAEIVRSDYYFVPDIAEPWREPEQEPVATTE